MRLRSEAGSVAIELPMAVGLLLIPITMLVLTFPTWVERQSMARLAAQEAARAVVLADSWSEGTAAGSALAGTVAANHDVDPGGVSVGFGGRLERGGTVTATVTVVMPVVQVPGIGAVGGFPWKVSHTEVVDRYRSFP